MEINNINEGLTFDDVLLVPAFSEILPAEVDTKTRFSRNIGLNIPLCSSAMDTVTEAALAIALAQQGGIGVIHKNFSIEQQAEEVDKVKRSESGMIVDPVTIHQDKLVSDALAIMSRFKISGVPVVDEKGLLVGIITNRDLRFETRFDIPVSEVMTPQPLVTVPGRHDARRGKDQAAKAPHRKAARRRRKRPSERPHHGQGHSKGDQLPYRGKGRARPPALCRRHRCDRRFSRTCDCSRRGPRRCDRHRHRPRPQLACYRRHQKGQIKIPRDRACRRQRRDRRSHKRADLGRRRRRKDRYRSRLDLHDACCHGCRRAADLGDCRMRKCRQRLRRAGHRGRRCQILGRRRQGHRRRCRQRDDRLALCRHRRSSGRGHPLPGPQLQDLSRHGLDRRDDVPARATATPRKPSRPTPNTSPKASRAASPTKAPSPKWSPN